MIIFIMVELEWIEVSPSTAGDEGVQPALWVKSCGNTARTKPA